ncbi:MAG: hypothetical protein ACRCSG_05610, partial [Cellulosilyticaceae bacterium]
CAGIADCMANKGATLVEGEKNGRKFHLIGTHLQAEDKFRATRHKQIKQMYKDLISPFVQKDIPMLISGDLNVDKMDSLSYRQMLTDLDAEDGKLQGEVQSTWIGMYGKWKKNDRRPIYDYVLWKKNSKKVKITRREAKIFRSPTATHNLSDHNAVEVEMEF